MVRGRHFMSLVLNPLAQGFFRLVLDQVSLVGNHTEDVVEAGDDHDSDQGADEHPADHIRTGTDGCSRSEATTRSAMNVK